MLEKTIYVVTSGQYSDYRINAIFSTRKLAQQFIAALGDRPYTRPTIEKWGVDVEGDHIHCGFPMFHVVMNKKGDIKSAERADSSQTYPLYWDGTAEHLEFDIFAKDELHAVKIANERRIQLIAENKI